MVSYQQWLEDQYYQQVDETYLCGMSCAENQEIAIDVSEPVTAGVLHALWRDFYRMYGHLAASMSILDGVVGDDWSRMGLFQDIKNAYERCFGPCPEETSIFEKKMYCQHIAYEFDGMRCWDKKQYLYDAVEHHKDILPDRLVRAERLWDKAHTFEFFINSQFPGQKRFSIEGLEVLVPMLKDILETLADQGVKYVGIGMAHRGRLNMLSQIWEIPWQTIVDMFKGTWHMPYEGDVKYHVGCQATIGDMRIDLFPNPAHLESVNSVVIGAVRAMQDKGLHAVAILIHGDASFSGQGVVAECFNMRLHEEHTVGGVIHIVANNHIGFTTPPREGRSSVYATDHARGVECPVVHVDGTQTEAVLTAVDIMLAYRAAWQEDVVLDIHGYREHGHNEADDPTITQPLMMRYIQAHKKKLSSEVMQRIIASHTLETAVTPMTRWVVEDDGPAWVGTPWNMDRVQEYWRAMCERMLPWSVHPKVQAVFSARDAMLRTGKGWNWACAEMLAFMKVLADDGHVYLVGQDAARGTFSQRMAAVVDQVTGQEHSLYALLDWKDRMTIANSPLSEYAVLGFTFGYACKRRAGLTIWEAQFGDFANGAQIIIDQYIVASFQRWSMHNNMVLLLPHGNEGQGAEHSSARVERFLQLACMNNMRVLIPNTPAQYYHALLHAASAHVPSIIMSPKSLLRHPLCISDAAELLEGTWQDVVVRGTPESASLWIMACGAVVYDLLQDPRYDHESMCVVSIESLYPFPLEMLSISMQALSQDAHRVYVQYEPENQGALSHIRKCMEGLGLRYVSREASCVPASGSMEQYVDEKRNILDDVFRSIL